MMRPLALIVPATLAVLLFAAPGAAAGNSDRDRVKEAVHDYVEGIYFVDPARIERSVHPTLRKLGFGYSTEKGTYWPPREMTYEQLHELAGSWNKDGHVDAMSAPKKVELYDVLDRTASAKLTADWGIDYMLLAKYDDKWMIINVLWQGMPDKQ